MREDDWHPRSRARRRNAHTVWAKSCTGRKRLPFLVVNMVDVKNGKAHPRQRDARVWVWVVITNAPSVGACYAWCLAW